MSLRICTVVQKLQPLKKPPVSRSRTGSLGLKPRASGYLKDPGSPLIPAGRVVEGRNKIVSDGSFVGTELVVGFSVVVATDIVEAEELAKGCPLLEAGGSVEVRLVQRFDM